MNKYYVYAYLREDLTPYYIGKGSGKRAWTSTRVTSKPTDLSRICILQNNLTEQEALDLEVKLIAQYGRKDIGTGILRNLTDGGDGVSGRITNFTEEWKAKLRKPKKMSETGRKALSEYAKKRIPWNKGKAMSEEQKKKLSEANTGKKRTNEVKEKMSQQRQGKPGKKHSEETKIKLSLINKGKKANQETKQKISESLKRSYAERKLTR
jgi:hypothetical protein